MEAAREMGEVQKLFFLRRPIPLSVKSLAHSKIDQIIEKASWGYRDRFPTGYAN